MGLIKFICIQGYGMSESTAVGTRGFNTRHNKNYSSVGLLAPNMQAKVVECVTGSSSPPGITGELWLRGPAIMKGTLHQITQASTRITKKYIISVVIDIQISYLRIRIKARSL